MNFIKLTIRHNDESIYVNVANIEYVSTDADNKTCISLNSRNDIIVKETVNMVIDKIKWSKY